ncbi:MAG: hypothetical protein K2K85_04885 [Clostridia bacterium]|nr:hypothetical protein [Clostridia bacterium]
METIQKMQIRERASGTLLRLGWLASIATFVPTLMYLMYGAIEIGRVLYLAMLALVALLTLFLILASEDFRNAFNAEGADVLPMVQKVYQSYSTLIYILLALGIVLAVLTILFAIKENNGKSSRRKIISSGCMTCVLILGSIVYFVTKSKVMGV